MSDLISRQAAMDAINRLDIPEDMCVFEILSHIELEIGTLPSAHPEDCDTCKHGYFGDDQCERCRVRYPSHYERRTDEV